MIDHPLVTEFGLNAEQAIAATLIDRHVCVEAGAGSGKTRVLVARLVGLLEPKKCTLDEVVAITFTRKAASEMRTRLREAFRKRAQATDVSAEDQSHWRDLIRRLESARINTIDGFCASLLREHSVRLGIDPDFAVLDESETKLLRDDVVRAELMRMLEEKHAGARRFAEEFGLRELHQSVLELLWRERAVERAVRNLPMNDPAALYALRREQAETAARALVERFVEEAELQRLCDYLESLDGHCSDASDKLEGFRRTAADALSVLIDGPENGDAARALADICTYRKSGKKENWDATTLEELREALAKLKELAGKIEFPEFDSDVELRAAQLAVDLYAVFRDICGAYARFKSSLHAMDFADLLAQTVEAVRRDADLRKRLREIFKHILIDEFQDTDPTQFELVTLLRATPEEPGPFVFVVGDVKQSIYRFRGADVAVFDEAKAVSDKTVELATNYRSDPAILGFVNTFYEKSKLLTTANRAYHPLFPHRGSRGLSQIEFLIPEENEEKTKIAEYRRREAALIAQRLRAMCSGEAQIFDGREYRPASFGDVAILFRAGTAMPIYEQVLREHDVPFVIEQGRGYFDRQEVHDVVNLLKFIVNPWDEVALVGFLRSPLAALSDNALMEMTTESRLAQAFYGTTELRDPEQQSRLARARKLVRECHAMRHAPVPELLNFIYEKTGFESVQLALHHAVQRASNVRKLLDSAEAVSASRAPNLHSFIRFVSQVHAYELVEGEAPWLDYKGGTVRLMSVHKSKGLEFPIVVLADSGCTSSKGVQSRPLVVDPEFGLACKVEDDDGGRVQPVVFNLAKDEEQRRELAEEARVLYVAMTRARDHLIIAGAPKPRNNSWLKWHDETFDVLSRADGELIHIGELSARVVRSIAEAPAPAHEDTTGGLDVEKLLRQAAPLRVDPRARESIGVDQVLDLIQPPVEFEKTRPAAAGIDPLIRGSVTHRFFEKWTDGPPEIDRVLEEFELGHAETSALRENLKQSAERFIQSPLYVRYRECEHVSVELPFMVSIEDRVLNGVIDALLSDGTIVDYKTGKKTSDRLARYSHQLRLYAYALRTINKDLVSNAQLYFTDSGEIVDVDVSPEAVQGTLGEVQAVLMPKKLAN